MELRILERQTLIKRPQEEVFDFFSKAENLNIITPPHLQFKILTPTPVIMQKGTMIDYKLKLIGIPFKWRTEISDWEPPFRFVDTQLKGPYKKWVHEHLFLEKNGNTLMIDKVNFLSPGWFTEPVIHKLFVQKNLENIFSYREKQITDIFKY